MPCLVQAAMLAGLGNAIVDQLEAACTAQMLPSPAPSAAPARIRDDTPPPPRPAPALQSATRVASLDLDLQDTPVREGADALLTLAHTSGAGAG